MISSHVLDTAKGNPAAGIPIKLHKLSGTAWSQLGAQVTSSDGRVSFDLELQAGTYQLVFDVEAYLSVGKAAHFYTEIPVIFKITDTKRKYHIPLLLNPFGYSTYRGS